MNWGKGIALLILSFVIFMSTLVYLSVKEDFYLVDEDYYTKGINYDEVQVKISNVKALNEKIIYTQANGKIEFAMPTEVKGGTLHFFRPSNGTIDFRVPIVDKEFYVDKTKIKKGKWVLKFSWTDGLKEYYIEESISVI